MLDSLAAGCQFELAVGGTSEALRVAVLTIREGKCLPGVLAPTDSRSVGRHISDEPGR